MLVREMYCSLPFLAVKETTGVQRATKGIIKVIGREQGKPTSSQIWLGLEQLSLICYWVEDLTKSESTNCNGGDKGSNFASSREAADLYMGLQFEYYKI